MSTCSHPSSMVLMHFVCGDANLCRCTAAAAGMRGNIHFIVDQGCTLRYFKHVAA
jgi:hypothetical protein